MGTRWAVVLAAVGCFLLTGCTGQVDPSPFARLGGLSRALRTNLRYPAFSSGGRQVVIPQPGEQPADMSSPAIDVPSAALSTVLKIPGAGPNDSDIVLIASRGPEPEANAKTYTWPVEVQNGEYDVVVEFYAEPGGTSTPGNPLVGSTTVRIRIVPGDTDAGSTPAERREVAEIIPGTGQNPDAEVRLDGPNAKNMSIEVTPGQSVTVGETQTLNYLARDVNGAVFSLRRSAVVFAIEPGKSDILELVPDPARPSAPPDGAVRGVSPGTASVTATTNGIRSQPASVTVSSGLGGANIGIQ